MKTYLYVDGENFATRARKFDEELRKDSAQRDVLKDRAHRWWQEHSSNPPEWHGPPRIATMAPRPHRSAIYEPGTKDGILYTKDEVYWDSVGLYIALNASLLLKMGTEHVDVLSIERAYYFTGVLGPQVDKHKLDLHAMGFVPHVFTRKKPDSFAQEMIAQGITVISRPKPMDILLATQVLDDCAADNFERCILVFNDADYAPLLESVRRRGKQVWLVAFERWLPKDERLRLACDRFIAYDPVLSVRPLPSPRQDEPTT